MDYYHQPQTLKMLSQVQNFYPNGTIKDETGAYNNSVDIQEGSHIDRGHQLVCHGTFESQIPTTK